VELVLVSPPQSSGPADVVIPRHVLQFLQKVRGKLQCEAFPAHFFVSIPQGLRGGVRASPLGSAWRRDWEPDNGLPSGKLLSVASGGLTESG
jgi:hypothetical protein